MRRKERGFPPAVGVAWRIRPASEKKAAHLATKSRKILLTRKVLLEGEVKRNSRKSKKGEGKMVTLLALSTKKEKFFPR